MRGPYGKLWTAFFPSFYGPSAKSACHENKEGKNEDQKLAVRTEQTRLIRCLLYGFVDYSGFKKGIESKRSGRLLTDLELTNHSRRNQSAKLHSGKMVLIGQKWLYSGKSGCIREKVVVLG